VNFFDIVAWLTRSVVFVSSRCKMFVRCVHHYVLTELLSYRETFNKISSAAAAFLLRSFGDLVVFIRDYRPR